MRRSFLLMLLTLSAATLAAQQPASTPQQPAPAPQPPIRVEANYVRVDVYPTRGGQPVAGLKVEDFELLEDGAPQKIEAFEHVVIQPAGPQATRVEPSSVREAEQAAANPRLRVFVIFLDVPHVSIASGHHIKEPLISLMDRMMGEDDLVAVMTPEMSPDQMTLGRKTEVIARGVRENWPWGVRDSIQPLDQRDDEYRACYPAMSGEGHTSALAQRMIDRRRERMVLEAFEDLIGYLGGIREERKAIITITEGWQLLVPAFPRTELGVSQVDRSRPQPAGAAQGSAHRRDGPRARLGPHRRWPDRQADARGPQASHWRSDVEVCV